MQMQNRREKTMDSLLILKYKKAAKNVLYLF